MSSDPSAKRPRRAVRVGKYEVVSHIATGGMGAVYKAIDTVLKREVALKVLPPEMASKPNALERFRREARNAARLRHENIVTIYEFSQAATTFYLAMEFVDGIDLQEYIDRKGRLEPEEARLIALQSARALEHAHTQGIVHRDIKPSNFLLARKGEILLVKMSDFGLARESGEEEARVTQDGHTVGTVDYMAPEQARDCGAADVRSDIYSLGCTVFHMLTGQAPFPGGSIPERLLKHAKDDPPDVRRLNPRASESFCAVLRRMLAKDPDNRYQTPSALLKDLISLESTAPVTGHDVLAGLALAENEQAAPRPKRRAAPAASVNGPPVPPKRPRGRRGEAAPAETPPPIAGAPPLRGPWVWALGGGAVVAVLAVIGVVIALRPGPAPRASAAPDPAPPPVVRTDDTGRATDRLAPPTDPPKKPPVVVKAEWPTLYEPSVPLDREALTKDFLGPWAGRAESAPDGPLLRVSRRPSGDGTFSSLEAACAAAPAGHVSLIEIDDNGPLFLTPVAVADRGLVIRAGGGYRPLLVWDIDRTHDDKGWPPRDGPALLSVTRGSLTLDRIDVVARWTETSAAGRPSLVRASNADLLARDCTFSFSGRPPTDLGCVRFERTGTGGPAPHCRLTRCVARGPGLVALALDAPGADVLLEGCLVVGTDQPLLQVTGRGDAPPGLRLFRSTLVADRCVLRVRPTAGESRPPLAVRSWDALLARAGRQAGGQMVVLADRASPARMTWQSVNCLYTGWRNLLTSGEGAIDDGRAWQAGWHRTEGELALAPAWPAVPRHDPSEAPADEFRPAPAPASPVGYAATSGPGPLGCDPAALPPARTNWLALAYDGYPAPALEPLADDTAPPVPAVPDGRYHGGRIDLGQVPDLGAFLEQKARAQGLGPRVVLHLAGAGEHHTRPIRVKGSSLVLYFEPPAQGVEPLALMPRDKEPQDGDALLEVDGGGLDMIGGEVRLPDYRLALLPPYALKVRGGDLRLYHCRLYGPVQHPPPNSRGLIRFEGASAEPGATPHGCAINECVLVAGKSGVHLVGGGARLLLRQSVLVSAEDGLLFEPGETAKRLDVQCLLDQTTVAARQAAVRVSDAPGIAGPVEPIVVQARFSAFLNPFSDAPGATLLVADGGALARGLVIWQGGGNAFDKRLAPDVMPKLAGAPGWAKLWGRAWERRQALDLPLKSTIDLARPDLGRLTTPAGVVKPQPGEEKRPPPGADFELLGLSKKPAKPR